MRRFARLFRIAAIAVALAPLSAHCAPPVTKIYGVAPLPTFPPAPPPVRARVHKYHDAPLVETLKQVAREGKLSTVIGEKVSGTITLETEPIMPIEAIRRIVAQKHLVLTKDRYSVLWIWTPEEAAEKKRLENPAPMLNFARMVQAKRPKAEFDRLPCKQQPIHNRGELVHYAFPTSFEVGEQAFEQLRSAKSVVVYRVDYRNVVVFFGADDRPRYDYIVPPSGAGLP